MRSIEIIANSTVLTLLHSVINFRVAKRLDLNCSQHKEGMIIMGGDKGVSSRYCNDHISKYQRTKTNVSYTSNLLDVTCQLHFN